MLRFNAITIQNSNTLIPYYTSNQYQLCEYSVGTKRMWGEILHPEYAILNGCLVVKNTIHGCIVFDYPIPGNEGDEAAALTKIETYCMAQGISPIISVVPEEKISVLLSRYPYVKVSNIRTWRDYLYRAEDMQNFAGRRYSGVRNHIKRFHRACPDAQFRPLTPEDDTAIERFWSEFEAGFLKAENKSALNELSYARRMLTYREETWAFCGGMFDGERLIGLSLGERCGETVIIHVEKALADYEGVYPALVQAFAQTFGGDATFFNREDDAADRGLRTSKLQYRPVKLAPKYRVEPQNELLEHVKEIPVLETKRLTLTALEERDIPTYYDLVRDRERNRWWGYDDVENCPEPIEPGCFYRVAQSDFKNRLAANFAVRLEGQCIGEAVLYNFNYRGDAELGCRIASEYAGCGYGAEAFAAVVHWGLYQVHLNRVVAKCYKENKASYKMLATSMKKTGEDETFYYFETNK